MKTTQIPLEELVPGRYYVSRRRYANVRLWNGHYFQTIGEKLDREVVKREPLYNSKYGCFQLFRQVDEG